MTEFEVEANTFRRMVLELNRRFPGLGRQIEESMAVVIDGEIVQDVIAPVSDLSPFTLSDADADPLQPRHVRLYKCVYSNKSPCQLCNLRPLAEFRCQSAADRAFRPRTGRNSAAVRPAQCLSKLLIRSIFLDIEGTLVGG